MSLLRIRAAEVLGALIEQTYPELAGRVCAGPADSGHKRAMPSIAIIPISFKFSPDQEDEWKDIGNNRVILNVGRYDSLFQIRVGAKNPHTRAKIEQQITDLMFSQEGRSGVLVIYIADCHDAVIGYEMDQASWIDEAGFSDKWFSLTTLNVVMPVLVERQNVFTMDEIRLCLRADNSADISEISPLTQECIAVDENGCVTLSTPPA